MNRKCSLNLVQKTLITEFLKNHPNLQTGKFSKEFTFKKARALWEELTITLNSVPNGAKKDWRQWRKTWQDLKKHTKSKAATVRKHTQGTGGGGPAVLSTIDGEILDLMSPSQVDGLLVKESTLKFDFQKENDMDVYTESTFGEEFLVENTGADVTSGKLLENTGAEEPSTKIFEVEPQLDDHSYAAQNENPGKSSLIHQKLSGRDYQDSQVHVSSTPTPKKINKTMRLARSLDISNNLVNSIDQRNSILSNYYVEKINHFKKDIEVKEKALSVLTDIKNILQNIFPSNPEI